MLAAELTLDAALRDVTSTSTRFRYQAAVDLAPALLEQIGQPGPRWRACDEHPQGPAVREALRTLLSEHEPADLRGSAAVGLGTLGEPEVLDHTEGWLQTTDDDERLAYLRESAVVATAYLGRAAIDAEAEPEVQQRVRTRIEQALRAEAPDVRYQAATALVELWGADAQPHLVEALRVEPHHGVREGLVSAIAYLDPVGPDACDALEAILEGDEQHESIGFEAAVTLAGARRPRARPRLLEALDVRHQRDRALEALAALGLGSPADVARVESLTQRWLLPSITRVRAAYALARMASDRSPNPGLARLRRLRFHPRAAVREAVREAMANLDTLARTDAERG